MSRISSLGFRTAFLGFSSALMLCCSISSYAVCLHQPHDASDQFGWSVDANTSVIVVGDPGAGSVWVYRVDIDGNVGMPTQLRAPAGSASATSEIGGFGYDVSIDSDGGLAVGAYAQHTSGVARRTNPGAGFRYLSELFVADLHDPAAGVHRVNTVLALKDTHAYGFSVSRSGQRVAVGLRAIIGATYGQGGAIAVDLRTNELQRIEPPSAEAAFDFGIALALDGDVLAVGAPWMGAAGGGIVQNLTSGMTTAVASTSMHGRSGHSAAISRSRVAFGGDGPIAAMIERGRFGDAVQAGPTDAGGVVDIEGTKVGILAEASRQVLSGDPFLAPAPAITVIDLQGYVHETILQNGSPSAIARWPRRRLALTKELAVVARPVESEDCKVQVVSRQ